ncbi:thermonuclease family protein [Rhizobium sp. IBUN]|uniref:thermonuclease family protein n=1 Tax=Rhizobium sp. IBUN TaxID=1042326 RepID=UPI0004024582|nr:thermonuclease family protein [Rhizobium sp. IBUN]
MKKFAAIILAVAALTASTANASDLRIIDGDTFELQNGETIRITGLDTPETWKPHCDNELDVGMQAADRLRDLLDSGPVIIRRNGTDRFGRTLARVYVGKTNVATQLVSEGLGLKYQKGGAAKLARLQHWCGPTAQLDY